MPNFANRTLYHGDNLEFLRGMDSETIHLIATDPPFNKNRDFHATPDSLARDAQFEDRWSWQDDIHDDWLISIQRDEPEVWQAITSAKVVYGDDMGAFLCWMAVRLLEMQRVLTPNGSIYLHCDSTANHYLKALMDAVFGPENFRTDIVWRRTTAHSDTRQGRQQHGRIHDNLLFYTKSSTWIWNPVYSPYDSDYVDNTYKYEEADTGRRYTLDNLTGPGGASKGNPRYDVMGVTRYWRYSQERMQGLIDEGRVVQTRKGAVPRYKRYLDEMPGVPLQDLWTDINPLQSQANERTGYPTQKPLALYDRIIASSSNPGDFVLDPFCGCATTPIAAERLGRQWVGMDIWDGAHQIVLDRLEAEGLAVKNRRGRNRGQQLLTFGDIHYETTPPKRTDDGEPAILALRTPMGRARERRHPAPRTQHGNLLLDIGPFCQGCGADYSFDPRVLEVDHINPRSQGGTDAFDNLTLLCPPCNKEKRDRYTLIGLQQANRAAGWMKNEANLRMGRAAGRTSRRRRR